MAISRFWNQLYSAIVFLLVCGMVSTLSAKPNQNFRKQEKLFCTFARKE